jgi:hypothetical protein
MFHSLRRITTAASLFGLLAVAIALTVLTPGRVDAHHLCGNTGSPFGPFDLQTYESADYRNAYARTMDLAGYNWLFPEQPSFALPWLETGGRQYGSGWTTAGYIPPVLLKSIAWIESGWSQASFDPLVQYGEIGPVLSSHDCGYGIMQVTSGMQNVSGVPSLDQAMIGGHYAFNIARGARILAEKWNSAPEFRPMVGIRNVSVIEDWYYALWGYNGFAFKNHPLNPDYAYPRPMYDCSSARSYPYQELIMGCAANPPSRAGTRLWNPQPVQLPNLSDPAFYDHLKLENWNACSQNLQCAAMDIPTPNPWNQDATYPFYNRSQVFGDPSVALSSSNLSFVALPGGQSPNQAVAIGNGGSGVLTWRLQTSAPWIQISRVQGVSLGADLGYTHQVIAVRADASSLLPGTHTGQITVETLWGAPATITVTVHTGDGALLNPADGRIYLYQGGLKRHIPDPATFEANGYSWNKVISVPAEWAAGVPTGHPIPSVLATGRLLKPAGNQVPIYVMENGAKRHITSMNTFWGCAYGFDSVDTVSQSTANSIPNGPPLTGHPCPRPSFPNGTLLKGSDGKLWVVQWNARKWVFSPGAASDCGYRAGNINDLGDSINGQLPISPNLYGCTAHGSLLLTEDGRINAVRHGQLRYIPDTITFELSGFGWGDVAPAGAISLPAGEPLPSLAMTGILFRPPGAQVPIYVLDGGVKRHITSPGVMDGCGYPWSAISTISASLVNEIPNGPALQGGPCPSLQFPFGSLLQGPDGAVWATLGQGRRWVNTYNAFTSCGYQAGKVNPALGTVLAGLFVAPPITSCTATNSAVATRDGKVYIVNSGWKRHVPSPATADALGVSWANLTPIPDGWLPTAKPLLDVAATGRLVRPPGDNVPIYVMDGGAKRHITSPAAMAACGYGWDAIGVLPAGNIAAFPNGAALSGAPCPQATFPNGTLLVGSEGKVWVMQSGQRRWVTNSSVFIACGYRGVDIDRIADSIIAALPQGANLSGPPCP